MRVIAYIYKSFDDRYLLIRGVADGLGYGIVGVLNY
jgi:hypothetical protein